MRFIFTLVFILLVSRFVHAGPPIVWGGGADTAKLLTTNLVNKAGTPIGSVTVDSAVTNGSANAVSGDAVFDALALKEPLVTKTILASTSAASNTGTTTAVVGLDAVLGANKTYVVEYFITITDPAQTPIFDYRPSYPASVSKFSCSNEFGQQNVQSSLTPANDALIFRVTGPGSAVFYSVAFKCTIATTTAGTLAFGWQNVGLGTATIQSGVTFVSVTALN